MARRRRRRRHSSVMPVLDRPIALAAEEEPAPPSFEPVPAETIPAIVSPAREISEPLSYPWNRRDTEIFFAVAIAGLLLYCWRLGSPGRYVLDEVYHAFTALRLVAGDRGAYLWYTKPSPTAVPVGIYEWTHPALAKLITQMGIHLLGTTPVGWRIASAVFGAIGIGMCYALGRAMFNRRTGILAASLLLIDGLWFIMSRTSMNDIFLSTFLLAAYLAFFLYLRRSTENRRRYLWLAGGMLGLAVATKWSGIYSLAAIAAIAALREGFVCFHKRPVQWLTSAATLAGAFAIGPAVIYVASYVQFFTMGHSWAQFAELQKQMFVSDVFFNRAVPWLISPWWTWPLVRPPMEFYVEQRGDNLLNVLAFGNPLVWWAFLPALAVCLWLLWRDRWQNPGLVIVFIAFFGQWLPWSLAPRSTYLYYILPAVPAGCLAIAYALNRFRLPRLLSPVYLAAALIAFAYFYPLYSAWPMSRADISARAWLTQWLPWAPRKLPANFGRIKSIGSET